MIYYYWRSTWEVFCSGRFSTLPRKATLAEYLSAKLQIFRKPLSDYFPIWKFSLQLLLEMRFNILINDVCDQVWIKIKKHLIKYLNTKLNTLNPFMHNVVKWLNTLLKSCGVHTFFYKHQWPRFLSRP